MKFHRKADFSGGGLDENILPTQVILTEVCFLLCDIMFSSADSSDADVPLNPLSPC